MFLSLTAGVGRPQPPEIPHALELRDAESPRGRAELEKYIVRVLSNTSYRGNFPFSINGVRFFPRVMPDDKYGEQATTNIGFSVDSWTEDVKHMSVLEETIIDTLRQRGKLTSNRANCADADRKRRWERHSPDEISWRSLGSMDGFTVYRGNREGHAVFKLVDEKRKEIEVTLAKVPLNAGMDDAVRTALRRAINGVIDTPRY